MPKPLRLLAGALATKIGEGSDDIILFEEPSSIKTFRLAQAKTLAKMTFGKSIYKMPPDTVSILQTNSRDMSGNQEMDILKTRLGDTAHASVPMSSKMLGLISSLEKKRGYPIKVVFAKRDKGSIYLCHVEPLELPTEAMIKVFGDLLNYANRVKRLRILKRIPLDFGMVQAEKFIVKSGTANYSGNPAYPGLVVVSKPEELFASETTSPADVANMKQAKVIITGGGLLSHAALLAASEGIPCVVGVSAADIKNVKMHAAASGVSVDAYAGKIYAGKCNIQSNKEEVETLLGSMLVHAREFMPMQVYANADSPEAIASAIAAGASGIGLLRTEHMFQEHTTILSSYLQAALKNDLKTRREALAKLLLSSRDRFTGIFQAAEEHYVGIRLLDAPLNEFGADYHEENSMMGLRGCRFGILFSDFYAMQVQAIAEGYKKGQGKGTVGIMLPMISEVGEVIVLRDLITRVWKSCGMEADVLKFGTMIETPRACLISGELAPFCDFFSYGSNDLTQFTFAFSRDDTNYLPNYTQLGVLEYNPFESLDARGVGRLIYLSAKMARAVKPTIELGLCGHHASDPASVKLVQSFGFNYVSPTKASIPKAILSMVQAV
jgi:pyruvate,orthophosphate dikinase